MKRQPQQASPEWARIVRRNPESYPVLVQKLAAATLHRADIYHDRAICQECAKERQEPK